MTQYDKLKGLVDKSQNIILLPHTSPDGDALGASFAFCLCLRKLFPDKDINVVSPDKIENYLLWMLPFMPDIIIWGDKKAEALVTKADLVIHLDHNDIKRLRHQSFIDAIQCKTSIVIDHHLGDIFNANIIFRDTTVSSTCELVFSIIEKCQWEKLLDDRISTMILTGMITDTGRFLYSCGKNTFAAAGKLINMGADIQYINDRLNYHKTENMVRLHSFIINDRMEIIKDLNLAIICITKEDLKTFKASKGDTEGIVNIPLEIENINISCLLREDNEFIKISFRSIGDISVKDIATHFGGGGHLNAAGGEYYGNIQDAKNKLIETIKNNR